MSGIAEESPAWAGGCPEEGVEIAGADETSDLLRSGEAAGDPRDRRCRRTISSADIGAHAGKVGVRPGDADKGEAGVGRYGDAEQSVAHEKPRARSIEAAPVRIVDARGGRPVVIDLSADGPCQARSFAIRPDNQPGADVL